MKTWILKAMW